LQPRFGCSEFHPPAGHRGPDVYRGVPDPGTDLWAVINDYLKPFGVKPDHQAENLAMGISLVASTEGVGLLPRYSQNLLPKTVVSRPIRGAPPTVNLVVGYHEANTSPLLKFVLAKVDDLKARVAKTGSR
jgi:LysR family hca operon transcriptional activator